MAWVETVYFPHLWANCPFMQTFVTLSGKYCFFVVVSLVS
jgi:hypothetical protein